VIRHPWDSLASEEKLSGKKKGAARAAPEEKSLVAYARAPLDIPPCIQSAGLFG